MEDRRSVGASNCNCGDGTDQRVQSLMFMIIIYIYMYIYIYIRYRHNTSMNAVQIFLQDILTFEDEDMALYRNVGIRLPVDKVSYTTRTEL